MHVHPADIELVFCKPIPTADIAGREDEQRLVERVREAIARNYIEQG
jgi:hypothetical protein